MACSFCALQATYVSVYDTAPLIPPPSIFCKRIPGEVQLSWSHSTGSTFGAKVSAVGPPCSTAPGGGQCGRAHRRRAACPKAVGTRAGSSPRGTAPAREPKTAPAASKSAPSQLSQQSLKQPVAELFCHMAAHLHHRRRRVVEISVHEVTPLVIRPARNKASNGRSRWRAARIQSF
jgi:hypothetical protein